MLASQKEGAIYIGASCETSHPICLATVHGMGSGSALRLSGMTKLWGCASR
jgi:hypothetical protein